MISFLTWTHGAFSKVLILGHNYVYINQVCADMSIHVRHTYSQKAIQEECSKETLIDLCVQACLRYV